MSTTARDLTLTRDFLAAAFDFEAALLEAVGFPALVGAESEAVCPVRHSFGDGCYIREWSSPAGVLLTSKVHRKAHPFFVLEGDVSVLTEQGPQRIVAPYHGITPAMTKRVLYTHEFTRWVTVHVTEHTDLALIEAEIISSDPAADLQALLEGGGA